MGRQEQKGQEVFTSHLPTHTLLHLPLDLRLVGLVGLLIDLLDTVLHLATGHCLFVNLRNIARTHNKHTVNKPAQPKKQDIPGRQKKKGTGAGRAAA
jgi:hypothetical protein